MLFVSHDRHFLAALSNRALELAPDCVHQYGGGYTDYVARRRGVAENEPSASLNLGRRREPRARHSLGGNESWNVDPLPRA